MPPTGEQAHDHRSTDNRHHRHGGAAPLIALGMRVVFACALVGMVGIIAVLYAKPNFDLAKAFMAGAGLAGLTPHSKSVAYTLSVLPMFILIGYLAFHAGITKAVFEAARRWIGWVPGGLAVASVFRDRRLRRGLRCFHLHGGGLRPDRDSGNAGGGVRQAPGCRRGRRGRHTGITDPAECDPGHLRHHRRTIGWRAVAGRFIPDCSPLSSMLPC